jgi:prepilin-type N-terminal cleavage/methylation domain-containing protein
MRRQKGFSLIELLIVVAIILIIAAIAIPNLLKARISANEASAVGSIRTINTGQISYLTAYPDLGFSSDIASLGPQTPGTPCDSTKACYIDAVLASGNKSGYTFEIIDTVAATTGTNPIVEYLVHGEPVTVGTTGGRAFCSATDAVIHYKSDGKATVTRDGCMGLVKSPDGVLQ